MGHVDAESVDSAVQPEAQNRAELFADLVVAPVQVRLLGCEQVQVPVAVGYAGPGRAAEHRAPVVGGPVAVAALSGPEDVPVALRAAGSGGQRFAEPGV